MRSLPWIAALFALSRFGAAPAAAQEDGITLPAIGVIDEQERHYDIGEVLQLNSHWADVLQAGGSKALRVRILRGSREELLRLKNRGIDGCIIYPSRLFRATEHDGGIKIQAVGEGDGRLVDVVLTENWLKSRAGQRIEDQSYVLVFEVAKHDEDILKLRDEDVEPYLKVGFKFVVRAPQQPLDEDRVNAIVLADRSARAEAAARVSAVANTRVDRAVDLSIEGNGKVGERGEGVGAEPAADDHAAGRATHKRTGGKKAKAAKRAPPQLALPCAAYAHLKFAPRVAHLLDVPCSCDAADVGL